MLITNFHSLPQILVDAVSNDPYSDGCPDGVDPSRYVTATRLVRPPQMNRLLAEHSSELQEDVSERLWALRGQAIHTVIERAAAGNPSLLSELRLFARIDDWVVGGRIDIFDLSDGHLIDMKDTSAWAVMDGMKVDWHWQLNVLAWLLRQNGQTPTKASILWLARDWSRTKAKYEKRDGAYPALPAGILGAPLLDDQTVEQWVRKRCHDLAVPTVRPCSDDERWIRGGGWAVMKQGGKRARKVLDTIEQAESWIEQQKDPKQWFLEGREASYERCEAYCPVRSHCRQAAGDALTFPEPLREQKLVQPAAK